MSQFGAALRLARGKMLQKDLAKAIGLSPQYIGDLELGRRDPTLTTIFAIEKALGIKTGDLASISGNREAYFGMLVACDLCLSEIFEMYQALEPG